MLKRMILVVMLALHFAAMAPVASADMDIPECGPCEGDGK
jgi:hypothetical protein